MRYTWSKDCLILPANPCATSALSSSCGAPAVWFWVAAAVVGGLLIAGGRK